MRLHLEDICPGGRSHYCSQQTVAYFTDGILWGVQNRGCRVEAREPRGQILQKWGSR